MLCGLSLQAIIRERRATCYVHVTKPSCAHVRRRCRMREPEIQPIRLEPQNSLNIGTKKGRWSRKGACHVVPRPLPGQGISALRAVRTASEDSQTKRCTSVSGLGRDSSICVESPHDVEMLIRTSAATSPLSSYYARKKNTKGPRRLLEKIQRVRGTP